MAILDRKMKAFHNKVVPLVKVQWQQRKSLEWTWEPEEEIRERYLNLFPVEDFEGVI